MEITPRHRKVARTVWECGGRIDEVAAREGLRPNTVRRWLADRRFRALLADDAVEPVLQAVSAMLRWAPVAVSRLIEDLEGDSAADARHAAREILKMALAVHPELARPRDAAHARPRTTATGPAAPDDPLARRVAALPDDQLARIFGLLNDTQGEQP